MNAETRWLFGGVSAAVIALVGWIVFAQAATDQRQDNRVGEVKAQSIKSDERQDQVLEKIAADQADTAASLVEVATTLRLIDERGTRAMLLSTRGGGGD
jgi:type VI protein secretion system component VasK